MRTDDPWYDALASGPGEHDPPPSGTTATALPAPAAVTAPSVASSAPGPADGADAHAAVYLAVQRSDSFQQVRRRYRRFVLPVSVAFLVWYLAYVVAATAAPGLMARPLAGVFNVAMAAGLAQFASTFLVTWAYVRHARLRRDALALELRWETQEMTRLHAGAAASPAVRERVS
ncbi:uncharacterized membrane protein (DUF485 family) [Streptomyces sp. Amel2xB2]|uniref:DUF485 domain-containing protein n=1 Tax=Streptomyces sp. Amel2xB2 TaxID=1305829 RepID=UPI000DB97402|nr:DUF485 domain-containing protein [Streptomyces sp. Amel2xB2]RAJ59009.1 uncharacterized membrane protein (DUF485 family) [Streptomyces sp. Amel2xB2]